MKNLFTFLLIFISLNIFAGTIRDKALEITKNDVTDIQKVTSITQWIYSNIKYDKVLADCDECSRETVDTYTYVYNNRKGVCVGMSNLFKYMADANGLETYVIGGIGIVSSGSGDHAWNVVETNRGYVCVDATWNVVTTNKAEFEKKHIYSSIYLDYSVGGIKDEIDEKTKYHPSLYLDYVWVEDEILYSNLSVDDYIDSAYTANRKKGYGYNVGYGQRINMEHAVRFRKVNRYLISKTTTIVATKTKTATVATKTKTTTTAVNDIPLIFTMSDSEFEKVTNYHYQYRENLAVYVSNKLNDKSLYNTIRYSKQKDYYKNMVKYRKMYLKGNL